MDFQELVHRLWRRRWVVALTLAIGSLIGLGAAGVQTPQYRAQSSLLIGPRTTSQQDLSQALDELAFSRELLRSYLLVLEGRGMAERLVERLQLPASPAELQSRIDARLLPDTRVVEVSVNDVDPARAATIANELVEVFRIEFQPAIGGGTVSATPITVASPPRSPISPRPLRTGLLGFFLAGFAVLGATLLRERLDVTVRTADDLQPLPVLAAIPDLKGRRSWFGLAGTGADPTSASAEAFRMLRAAVEFRLPEGASVVLLTSPEMGDGKSTIAMALARASSRAGQTVALVDMDLRRPTIHTRLGLPLAPGVADATDGALPETHIVEGVRVITAGATIDQTSENPMLEQLGTLADKLRQEAEISFIDTPPVNVVDPLLIARHVQGVILVARAGRSTRREIERAAQRITDSGGELIGIVLNGVRERDGAYGYGYGYGYGGYGYGRTEQPSEPGEAR